MSNAYWNRNSAGSVSRNDSFIIIICGFAMSIGAVLVMSHLKAERWLAIPYEVGRQAEAALQSRLGGGVALDDPLRSVQFIGLSALLGVLVVFASAVGAALIAAIPSVAAEKTLGQRAGNLFHRMIRDALMGICFVSWACGATWQAYSGQGQVHAIMVCLAHLMAFRLLVGMVPARYA